MLSHSQVLTTAQATFRLVRVCVREGCRSPPNVQSRKTGDQSSEYHDDCVLPCRISSSSQFRSINILTRLFSRDSSIVTFSSRLIFQYTIQQADLCRTFTSRPSTYRLRCKANPALIAGESGHEQPTFAAITDAHRQHFIAIGLGSLVAEAVVCRLGRRGLIAGPEWQRPATSATRHDGRRWPRRRLPRRRAPTAVERGSQAERPGSSRPGRRD